MSYASKELKRIGSLLKESTKSQIDDYKERFKFVEKIYDPLLRKFIRQGYDINACLQTAKAFFNSDIISFAAIDGSRFSDSFFDMVIFFGGAYVSTGMISFQAGKPPEVAYTERYMEEGQGISSCIPLYVNQVLEVDQTFFAEREAGDEKESELSLMLGDDFIIDNSRIADVIMHFAEYFLAYTLITDKKRNVKLLLFDRTLSGDQAALIAATSNRDQWERCAILGYEIDEEIINKNDLMIGRYNITNEKLKLPPPRGDYLQHQIIQLLGAKGPLTPRQICHELDFTETDRIGRVEKSLENLNDHGIVDFNKKTDAYSLKLRYVTTWQRLQKLVQILGRHLFFEGVESVAEANKFQMTVKGQPRWLTTLDLNFLTLFCLYMVIQEAWKNNVLMIGITKDTAARDFKSHFVPICHNAGLIRLESPAEWMKIPHTDRMILQATSLINYDKMTPPWALIEYDTAFKTMVPDTPRGPNYVRGAIQNKVAPERLFVKTYLQLVSARSDPKLRGNVLCVDRLVYADYDLQDDSTYEFKHHYGADEDLEVIIYKSSAIQNLLQNLIITILVSMSEANIPELFGHNKPLFIADKIAKWHTGTARKIVESIKNWVMNNPDLRQFVFYMSTFRERRERIERYRRA